MSLNTDIRVLGAALDFGGTEPEAEATSIARFRLQDMIAVAGATFGVMLTVDLLYLA